MLNLLAYDSLQQSSNQIGCAQPNFKQEVVYNWVLRMKLVVHYYNPDECSSVHARMKPICILWSNLIRIITAMSTKWGGGREYLAFFNSIGIIAIHNNWKAVRLIYRHHSAFSTKKRRWSKIRKKTTSLHKEVTQLLSFLQDALRSEAAAYVQPKTSNDEAH